MKRIALILIFLFVLLSPVWAAQWQFMIPIDANGHRAYVWIPPTCQHVRGLIMSDQNMLEGCFFSDPQIRQVAAKHDLAFIWFKPKSFRWFQYKNGADKAMLSALKTIAAETGYWEIENAPYFALGNSASTPFCWYAGYWKPERTIAILSLKGAVFGPPEFDPNSNILGVPALAMVGQFCEWPTEAKNRFAPTFRDKEEFLKRQSRYSDLTTFFVDVSRAHFDYTQDMGRIMAMYIDKAAAARLPSRISQSGQVVLNKIDAKSGWLMDPNAWLAKHIKPAKYKKYKGDRSKASWVFDKEMAMTIEHFDEDQKTKHYQMITAIEDGNILPVADLGYTVVKFKPLQNDQMSFSLEGAYLEELPEKLINQPPLAGHSKGPIHFFRIGGPCVQTSPTTLRIEFDAFNSRVPAVASLIAQSDGDDKYCRALQPITVNIPACTEGKLQKIDFEPISNQKAGTKSVALKAASDANLPVQFFVNYGPVEIQGDQLVFSKLPPKIKFPIKVSVVATQWGSLREPKIQTAKPVERIFFIENSRTNQH